MALDVLSRAQETILNKESPAFYNYSVGTGLRLAQTAINQNETSIGAIKGAGYTNETIKGNATAIAALATLVGKRVSIGIAAGVRAGVVDISTLDPDITEIVAIFAITTATGAVAAQFLLAPTTDYTFEDGVLETVTDQSANTLIVVYK